MEDVVIDLCSTCTSEDYDTGDYEDANDATYQLLLPTAGLLDVPLRFPHCFCISSCA